MSNHVMPDVARPTEERKNSRVGMKLLITAVVLGLVGVVGGLGTWSAFSDTTANGGNSFESGSVTIEDDDSGSAMFSLTGMRPGDPAVSKCIDVTYTGSLDAQVRMYGTTGGTGLAQYLNVKVTRGEKNSAFSGCGDFTADTTNYIGQGAGVVYNGTLEGFADGYAGANPDPVTGAPETWSQGEDHAYRFEVSLADNNNAQAKTATQTFTWEAQ
jgi:predicted ribosomally synthesized peptide with SipW-like signal peptide